MKKYKIKIKELLPYWKTMRRSMAKFHREINMIECKMQKRFEDKDLSFFWIDGDIVGIGTYPTSKKMDLIHDSDFEKQISKKHS